MASFLQELPLSLPSEAAIVGGQSYPSGNYVGFGVPNSHSLTCGEIVLTAEPSCLPALTVLYVIDLRETGNPRYHSLLRNHVASLAN